MDETTWMNAKKAIELGFADDLLTDEKLTAASEAYAFSANSVEKALINRISEKAEKKPVGRKVSDLKAHLNTVKKFM